MKILAIAIAGGCIQFMVNGFCDLSIVNGIVLDVVILMEIGLRFVENVVDHLKSLIRRFLSVGFK